MPTKTATHELNELDWQLAYAAATRHVLSRAFSKRDRRSSLAISPSRENLIVADIRFLSPLLMELESLRTMTPDRDEYGILRATQFAYDTTSQLLIDSAIDAAFSGRQIPRACASTDSEGGVRIEWVRPNKSVHLAIPAKPDRDGYIYHEVGSDYATEPATSAGLARWLNGID